MLMPETLKEAIANGYMITEKRLARGYISRRVNPAYQPVKIAGGSRKGQLFVELPNFESTTYHYRCYLTKPIDK